MPNFFLEYVEDLHIIIIRVEDFDHTNIALLASALEVAKSWTILAYKFKCQYYTNGRQRDMGNDTT